MKNSARAFVQKEIQKMKKLRRTVFAGFAVIGLGATGFLAYMFFSVYKERGISQNFFSYAGPTLLQFQVLIVAALSPMAWIVARRFRFTIEQLGLLNTAFARIYKSYCTRSARLFSGIPSYIFSPHGLAINTNFTQKILKKNDFDRVQISRFNAGSAWGKCTVHFYQDQKIVARLHYAQTHPEEVDFLLQHLALVREHVPITEKFKNTIR